jgi:hypothetical protein
MARRLLRTHAVRAVARALLDAPDEPHWGAELCEATGERSSVVHPILGRLLDAGLLTDEGWVPSDVGGSSRHVYRVAPGGTEGLRDLVVGRDPKRRRAP